MIFDKVFIIIIKKNGILGYGKFIISRWPSSTDL